MAAIPPVLSPQWKKKPKEEQCCESKSKLDLTALPHGCEYQVLVFKCCKHGDFYLGPRGTLRSESWGADGAGGEDEAHAPNPRTDGSTQRGPGSS